MGLNKITNVNSYHKTDATNSISRETAYISNMNHSDVVKKERNVGALFVPVKSILNRNTAQAVFDNKK